MMDKTECFKLQQLYRNAIFNMQYLFVVKNNHAIFNILRHVNIKYSCY